jgi:hypothetical protein
MRTPRRIRRSLTLASLTVAATLAFAPVSQAQGQRLFDWSGRVDREVRISIRGNDVRTQYVGNNESGRERTRLSTALPHAMGSVTLSVQQGRGNVDVVQQPDARNDFTAVIRILDTQSGSADYRISAYWQPAVVEGDRGRGNGRGEGRGHGDEGRGNEGRGGYNNGGGQNAVGGSLHWSGSVDGVAEIRIQGNRVMQSNLSGAGTRDVRYNLTGQPLMGDGEQAYVSVRSGRGNVSVVEQPSRRNNYTAVVRVSDPQGGMGYYDFDVSWR